MMSAMMRIESLVVVVRERRKAETKEWHQTEQKRKRVTMKRARMGEQTRSQEWQTTMRTTTTENPAAALSLEHVDLVAVPERLRTKMLMRMWWRKVGPESLSVVLEHVCAVVVIVAVPE